VPDRHDKWSGTGPRANCCTDNFPLSHQWCPGSSVRSRLAIRAVQARFGRADRRQVEQDAHMTRQTAAARMRSSLPVDDEKVRCLFESPNRFYDHWRLSEAEKPWNVGKGYLLFGDRALDLAERQEVRGFVAGWFAQKFEADGDCDRSLAAQVHICARNEAGRLGKWGFHYLLCQFFLQTSEFLEFER
jgi:hypothetical protein